MARHDLFTAMLTHALACGQTRSVNLSITQGMSGLRKEGDPTNHHTYTHEEPIDSKAGYQLQLRLVPGAVHEGAVRLGGAAGRHQGRRSNAARSHRCCSRTPTTAPRDCTRCTTIRSSPSAVGNGRLKTGLHIPKPGDAATRVTFTLMQAMGVPISSFGSRLQSTSPRRSPKCWPEGRSESLGILRAARTRARLRCAPQQHRSPHRSDA